MRYTFVFCHSTTTTWLSKTLTMGGGRYRVEKLKKVGNLRLWGEAKSREGDERVLRKEKNSNQWWVNR